MGTKRTRICRAAVTAIALMICFGIAVEAAGVTTIGENHLDGTFEIMRRASNSFDVTIPAGEIMAAETSFSMSAGESVKFHAVYEPREASVDYGLIPKLLQLRKEGCSMESRNEAAPARFLRDWSCASSHTPARPA